MELKTLTNRRRKLKEEMKALRAQLKEKKAALQKVQTDLRDYMALKRIASPVRRVPNETLKK